jgi:hypothetical protein
MESNQIFQFTRHPFDMEDNFSRIDLTKAQDLNMCYSWIEVKQRLTRMMGRNTLYTILRLYGYTDRFNRPRLEMSTGKFRWVSSSDKKKWKLYYPGKGHTYITGAALALIMKLISHYHRMVA